MAKKKAESKPGSASPLEQLAVLSDLTKRIIALESLRGPLTVTPSVPISGMTSATSLDGTEVLPIVQTGANKKTTIGSLGTVILPSSYPSSQIAGTGTNDNAPNGFIGQYSESDVAFGSKQTMSVDTPQGVASLSLTQGDWDVTGCFVLYGSAATLSYAIAGIELVSVPSFPSQIVYANNRTFDGVSELNSQFAIPVPTVRVSVANTGLVTAYLCGVAGWGSGDLYGYGRIRARRVR